MLKLKLDENGNAVLKDGKPVYVYDDGKEVTLDGGELFGKIKTLNEENKSWREKAQAAEDKVSKYGDIDPTEVEAFLDEIDALGGFEAIRKGSKVDVEQIKAEMSKVYDAKLAEKDTIIAGKDGHIYKLEVSNRFKSSPIMEKLVLPPDLAESAFGSNFKIEEGSVVGYLNGQRIFSREKPGELASFDEALAQVIDAYPMKDRILKGSGSSGSGAQGGQSTNNGSIRSRADFKTDADKSKFISENGLDAFKQLPVTN